MQREFLALLKRIRRLSVEMLPASSPTARYTHHEVFRMLGFRLLAHAEIEAFLEWCAEDVATLYAAKNNSRTLSPKTQKYLVLHTRLVASYPPRSLSFSIPQDAYKIIKGMLNGHLSMINQNNGASEKDVLKLFVPLGCDSAFFDHRWLASLNALAAARGEVAHNSSLVAAPQRQPTPEGERDLLVQPLVGIRSLVRKLDELKLHC
jgi:hypothetical protein